MKRNAMFLLLLLTLNGCSTVGSMVADAVLPGKGGVDVTANVSKGDAEGDDSVAQNGNTNVSVEGDEQTYGPVDQVVNEYGMPTHILLMFVLLAGWAIPSPSEMGHGLLRGISAIRSTLRGSDGKPRR